MITLQNIANAFCKLEHDARVLVTEPWITDGIFEGGWATYPPIQDTASALSKCDYLYISHIHEDHFDLKAIEQLPRTAVVIIPDLFPNHLIRDALAKLGFKNLKMLKPLTPFALAPDLTVSIIPPLNGFAQEQALYQTDQVSVGIDTGLLVNWDGVRLLMLNDNSPYDLEPLAEAVGTLRDCDLLGVNYNGGADDYPICYRGLSAADKRALCDRRDTKKLEANLRLIRLLQPKAVLAYSSDFSVCGPQALTFAAVRQGVFSDKQLMAERLQQESGVPAFGVYEDDRLEVDRAGTKKIAGKAPYPTIEERAAKLYRPSPNYAGRFPAVNDLPTLWADARRAAEHMFHYMDKYGWTSEWVLEIRLNEDESRWYADLSTRKILEEPVPNGRKRLTCFTDARHFGALVRRLTHWNNAMISYNLEWERVPNEYDALLYKAINFFHKPSSARNSATRQ
jgi:UDP-MurNAc hydroxylase